MQPLGRYDNHQILQAFADPLVNFLLSFLLFCSNCVFEKCSASMGGAVYNDGDAYLLNSDCKNNTANLGGAVFNLHNLKITSSYFKNNFAGRGGAIYSGIETNKALIRHCRYQCNSQIQYST